MSHCVVIRYMLYKDIDGGLDPIALHFKEFLLDAGKVHVPYR